ncbi:MAG: type II secretion system F family protein, partial [Nanoarchaeota archaeon]|nr:type II secretion system F family protein [Nanoarchaeota archaeon]
CWYKMVYRLISRIYPRKFLENYKKLLDYANIRTDPTKFLGFVLVFGFLLGWVIAFPAARMFSWSLMLTFVITFTAFEVFVYMWISLSIEAKAVFMEKALPDALQLMSSNLRAGLTPEKALLLSARPEFGPLTTEINRVGKEIAIGKDIDEALLGITKRVKSDKISKTVMLIVSGIRAGGELASLLDQTARNLRDQDFVDQKIRSSVRMYVIFIFSAVGLGAPMLYGLSSFLVEVMTNVLGKVEIPKTTTMSMPINITQVSISIDFVIKYVITSLIITSILGSMVLGLINKGEEKQGLKYAPVLIGITLAVFFLVRFFINNLLTGLFTF